MTLTKKSKASTLASAAKGVGNFFRNFPEKAVNVAARQVKTGPALIGAPRLDVPGVAVKNRLKEIIRDAAEPAWKEGTLKKSLKFRLDKKTLKEFESGALTEVDLNKVLRGNDEVLKALELNEAKMIKGPLGGSYVSKETVRGPVDMVKDMGSWENWKKGFDEAAPAAESFYAIPTGNAPAPVKRVAGFLGQPITAGLLGYDAYNVAKSGDPEEYKRLGMQTVPAWLLSGAAERLGGRRHSALTSLLAYLGAQKALSYNPLLAKPKDPQTEYLSEGDLGYTDTEIENLKSYLQEQAAAPQPGPALQEDSYEQPY